MDPQQLSEEQIAALVKNGDLNHDNAKYLSEDEFPLFQKAYIENMQASHPEKAPGVDWGAMAGLGAIYSPLAIPKAISAGSGALKAGWDVAKIAGTLGIANYGLDKLGMHGDVKSAIMMALGLKGMTKGMGGKAGGVAAGEGAAVASAEANAVRTQLAKQGYPPELIEKIIAADSRGAAVGAGSTVKIPGSNVVKEGPLTGNGADVTGGVTNDFNGRATIVPNGPPSTSFNPIGGDAMTQWAGEGKLKGPVAGKILNQPSGPSLDEIIEQVLGTSRTGRTPMLFHDSAEEGTRRAIDGLKRTALRSPK